jgi:hypothetical protein
MDCARDHHHRHRAPAHFRPGAGWSSRADRRSRDRTPARRRAPPAACLRPCACGRRARPAGPGNRWTSRARLLPPPVHRRHLRQPVSPVGGGRARLKRPRPRPLLPRAPRRPPPPAENDRRGATTRPPETPTGSACRSRAAHAAPSAAIPAPAPVTQPTASTTRTAAVRSSCSSTRPARSPLPASSAVVGRRLLGHPAAARAPGHGAHDRHHWRLSSRRSAVLPRREGCIGSARLGVELGAAAGAAGGCVAAGALYAIARARVTRLTARPHTRRARDRPVDPCGTLPIG